VMAPYRVYDPVLGRWLSEDPIEEAGGVNLYGYVGNGPVGAWDPLGLDTYIVNRQLNPDGAKTRCAVYGPLSHTFGYTTNPNGSLKDTYSWGNDVDQNGVPSWFKNAPEDTSAAREDIRERKTWGDRNAKGKKMGGAELDPHIENEFQKRKHDSNHPSRHKWKLTDNCKHEASELVDDAIESRRRSLQYPLFIP